MTSSNINTDGRLVVSVRRAMVMLDCGRTHLYELLESDKLKSFRDGRSRKITVASIQEYIRQQLAAAELQQASVKAHDRRG